jgi:predicted Holliday junction resolvase-like endonuclease
MARGLIAAVDASVVVIVVAVAVVLIVLMVTGSIRGVQRRSAARRAEAHHDLDVAEQRVERAEHGRDVALGEEGPDERR